MKTLYTQHRWLTLVVAALVSTCAVAPITGVAGTDVPETFNLRDVYGECNRLGCREPNRLVAKYFSRIVEKTGKGCVVHITPERGEIPWKYWDEYVKPMQMLLAGSQIRIYAYVPAEKNNEQLIAKAKLALEQIKRAYKQHGAHEGAIAMQIINHPSAVMPPYQEPYCLDRPVLEIKEGARVVSPTASGYSEHVDAADRAARAVLVVVDK